MISESEDTKFDLIEVANYVNPGSKATLTTGPDGLLYRWEWDDKYHELLIPAEKIIYPDLILERLFEAAIEMAKR